jgi:uncharacterized phage protein (TIGR02218 family)
MRKLSIPVIHEIQKPENSPIELYQVFLEDATYYLAGYDTDVRFFNENGQLQVYEAVGISRTPIRTNIDSRIDECTITLNNVTNRGSQLLASTDLIGRRVRILKVFQGLLEDPANYILVFEGVTDEPAISKEALRLKIKSRLDSLTTLIPQRKYSRLCSWKFGSSECGINLNSVTATSTVSNVVDGKIISMHGRNDPRDYWVDGVLRVDTPGRPVEKRLIIASAGSVVEVDFPFEHIALGSTLTIRRGCAKTYTQDCVRKFGNGANFGGFVAVPTKREVTLRKPWAKVVVDEAEGKK